MLVLFLVLSTALSSFFQFQQLVNACAPKLKARSDSKIILDVPTLIRSNEYPSERHKVMTSDGYILELHRIPQGKSQSTSSHWYHQKPVVLMVHCLLCTSSIWVMQGPRNGLAYMLADDGYDVWMMNTRGTSYSKNHVTISMSSRKFWDFSWHEKGFYDVPASIDYILDVTNQSKLNYVGYSMGTTIFFTMASARPEYNDKIEKAVAIAPAVFVSGAKGLLADLCLDMNLLENVLKNDGELKFPSERYDFRSLLQNICDYSNVFIRPFCASILKLLAGVSMKNFNWKKLNYYFKFFPDYTSVNTVLHFCQVKNTGLFRQFDYGRARNIPYYGFSSPPMYNLSAINTPVHLIYSMTDSLTTAKDVSPLLSLLPHAYNHPVDVPLFSHAHFCWGKDAPKIVYEKIMTILDETL